MHEHTIKHLEMNQAIVNRMATNSFLIKGWSVTLTSALFALAAKESNYKYVVVTYFPVLAFWLLDGYFLFQERVFRALYDKVRSNKQIESDFSMSTAGLDVGKATWQSALFSSTIILFHGPIFLTVCVVMFVLK